MSAFRAPFISLHVRNTTYKKKKKDYSSYYSFSFQKSPYRRLDANLLSEIPAGTFRGVRSLRHLWLDDNSLADIPVMALDSLPSLQAMTLALNQITHIPDYAFTNLSALVVL